MTPAEIIEGLRTPNSYAGEIAVQEAIAHLQSHSQPITPEGLEARGFERDGVECWREFGKATLWHKPDTPLAPTALLTGVGSIPLPGVRTLGDVDDLIRMLEGGE